MRSGVPFGRYTLVRRLARGGMAEIFLALQEGPEGFSRRLVIKRILPHLAADPVFLRMFMDEARIVAMLSHPHIVHLYDFGQVEGSYYLAMEYIDGVDLKLLGERAGPVLPEHAAKIMSYVCEGLSHAHDLSVDGRRLGLVHRDVTPSNILISFDGSVKVADFGIAKTYSGDEKTRAGVVKGKFAYLSPEQARGLSLDHRSDQFNIGILLYELLTGTNLFPHDSFQRAMRAIIGGQIEPPQVIQPGVPASLSRIVMKALDPDRDARYPDTLAFRAELEAFLRESPAASDAVLIGRYIRELFPEHGDQGGIVTGALPQGTAPIARPQTRTASAQAVPEASPIEPTRKEPAKIARPLGEARKAEAAGPAPLDIHEAPTDMQVPLLDQEELEDDPEDEGSADGALTTMVVGPARFPRGESAWELGRRRRRRRTLGIGLLVMLVAGALTTAGLLWTRDTPAGADPAQVRIRLPPPRPRAQVRLRSTPAGAQITLDGSPTSLVTPAILTVDGGVDHTIALSLTGHRDTVRHVVPAPGRALEVHLQLEAVPEPPVAPRVEPASLQIDSTPAGARAVIDDVPRGGTPLTIGDLPPGEHVVRLLRDGFEPVERRLTLASGARESLDVRLRRTPHRGSGPGPGPAVEPPAAYGTLTINTFPWSKVYLGGRLLGMTPLANVRVPAGRHTLRLVNPDRPPKTIPIVVAADQNTRVPPQHL